MFDSQANLHVPVEKPLVVKNPQAYAWDHEADVVVVGLGAAGASAAIEAASLGARVLVLDRLNGGGASAMSGGVVYAGGGTRYQRENGIEDTPDNMFEYLRVQVGGVVSDATLRRFCESSVANLEWLEQMGARFSSRFFKEKNSFPGGAWGIYYSGNEAYAPYNERAKPAPRGHVTQGSGYFGGPSLMKAMTGALTQRFGERARLLRFAEVYQLVVDGENQVIGLRFRVGPQAGLAHALRALIHRGANLISPGAPRFSILMRKLADVFKAGDREQAVRVRKGVVLSAGGFIFNRPMLSQATGGKVYSPHALGEDCNGSGIRLGLEAGAAADRLDRVTYWRFFVPPHALLSSVVVGLRGERLCSEALYGATIADVMFEKSDGKGWLIVDKPIWDKVHANLRGDMALVQKIMGLMYVFRCTTKAATLADLARKIGIPTDGLEQTVRTYNQRISEQQPDEFAKPQAYRQTLTQGPFYAVNIGVGYKGFPCPSLTLGGLRINEDNGAVLDGQGREIRGLYAAGRNAVGLCSHTYISGLSLADCIFSGRRAGLHAAQQATS